MIQEICYIDWNDERKLCTVYAHIKEFLSIVETKNKKYHRYSKLKTPVELVTDREHIDNSKDDYEFYIQKIMILQVIQQIFVKC